MMKLISIAIALVAVGLGLFLTHKLRYVPEMPELDQNKWWGSGPRPTQEDTEIRPFKIEFSDTVSCWFCLLYCRTPKKEKC